jgi:hypothetical protein
MLDSDDNRDFIYEILPGFTSIAITSEARVDNGKENVPYPHPASTQVPLEILQSLSCSTISSNLEYCAMNPSESVDFNYFSLTDFSF